MVGLAVPCAPRWVMSQSSACTAVRLVVIHKHQEHAYRANTWNLSSITWQSSRAGYGKTNKFHPPSSWIPSKLSSLWECAKAWFGFVFSLLRGWAILLSEFAESKVIKVPETKKLAAPWPIAILLEG